MEAVAQPPTTFRLTPRPYQYEAVAALLAAAARGVQRPLLVLPTGTGKTIIFALLVQRRGGRALILAHRDELIQQAVDKLHLVDPTLPLGVVQAEQDVHDAPTVVASVQTLSRRTQLCRRRSPLRRPVHICHPWRGLHVHICHPCESQTYRESLQTQRRAALLWPLPFLNPSRRKAKTQNPPDADRLGLYRRKDRTWNPSQ